MSQLQNWSHVINNVQNANLDQHLIEKKIKGLNKRAYRQELDREVEVKNYQVSLQNALKRRQLQQAKYLAQAQKMAKIHSRQIKQRMQKHYGQQNEQLSKLQHNVKSHSKQMQRRNIKNFLQHPFVKLVQGQDNRMQHLRRKFIKQNQINHLQEQMHNQQRQANRYKEMQQKNQFIEYVQQTHQKRSADREKFKNKYLKIKRTQLDTPLCNNIQQQQSVEKMYVSYLNHQIQSNHERKLRQKAQSFDDKRIQQLYSNGQVEPDSSPAFLGRNPLSHERKRQLYFINKHLNTHHERSLTSNSQLNSKTEFVPSMMAHREQVRSNQYLNLASQLNPQENNICFAKKLYNPTINSKTTQSSPIRQHIPQKHMVTQNNVSQKERSYNESPQIYSTIKTHNKSAIDNSRRIKSQLFEQKYSSPQKLPTISNKLLQPHRQTTNIDISSKKQYFRYDLISGKQVPVYM